MVALLGYTVVMAVIIGLFTAVWLAISLLKSIRIYRLDVSFKHVRRGLSINLRWAVPNKCDPSIYECDKNDFASSIASAALGAPDEDQYSGSPIDQGARSKGADDSKPSAQRDDFPLGKEVNNAVVRATIGTGGDSRAHTAGNHGEQD